MNHYRLRPRAMLNSKNSHHLEKFKILVWSLIIGLLQQSIKEQIRINLRLAFLRTLLTVITPILLENEKLRVGMNAILLHHHNHSLQHQIRKQHLQHFLPLHQALPRVKEHQPTIEDRVKSLRHGRVMILLGGVIEDQRKRIVEVMHLVRIVLGPLVDRLLPRIRLILLTLESEKHRLALSAITH